MNIAILAAGAAFAFIVMKGRSSSKPVDSSSPDGSTPDEGGTEQAPIVETSKEVTATRTDGTAPTGKAQNPAPKKEPAPPPAPPPAPAPAPAPSQQSLVPNTQYCSKVANWPAASTKMENQVLALINQRRGQGGSCGQAGSFGPMPPLKMNPELRCSARLYSKYMADTNTFVHVTASGETPGDRVIRAGYDARYCSENIARGQSTPQEVVAAWIASPSHCAAISDNKVVDVGVGYYTDGASKKYWTLHFGKEF